nr:hypothetical protein [Nocardioides carbamazepini]
MTGPGDAHDGPVQGLGPPGHAEGAAADGALDDHGAFGQAGDNPVPGEEPGAGGRGSRWRLGDDQAAVGDRLEQLGVRGRVGPVDPAGHDGDGRAAGEEGAAVRCLVHAVRESADDGVAHGREVPAQLRRLMCAVACRGARPNHGHRVSCEPVQVAGSPDPQPDWFAAAIVQCAGATQAREAVGPLGIAGDDEPDAPLDGLLEDLAGIDVGELVADGEAPVILYLAGGLEVVEDLDGAELADQPGDAQVAGLDGTAELDAGQPVGVVDVGVRGAHDACS